MTSSHANYDVIEEDIEYLHVDNLTLKATVYRPQAPGPLPLMIEVHGGSWTRGTRGSDRALNQALASRGVVVAAVDFRMPPVATHPGSISDVIQAVQWFKSNADRFGSEPGRVGVMGTSSGGHIALLSAMSWNDPEFRRTDDTSHASRSDTPVSLAVLCWPVIDPISRYLHLKRLKADPAPCPPWVETLMEGHETYWLTEEAMSNGTPSVRLASGKEAHLPFVAYFQAGHDRAHPEHDLNNFVAQYRARGGAVWLEAVAPEGKPEDLEPGSTAPYRSTLERLVGKERERVFDRIGTIINHVLGH